ncbi:MAG TPA: hypothetical protein PLV68_09455, partial [Ilumatobacteraceae bacterium]|nr:hypothetical protein [Ilumatobacteraceae bacterium]
MASNVEPSDLPRHLAHYGPRATVLTVSDAFAPHVGTSLVELIDERLVFSVGPSAAGHLAARPTLCLTWTPPPGEDYQLILDAIADAVTPQGGGFRVSAVVGRGIRHRVADAAADGPS